MALPPPSYGSTILITGASSGIGADLARQLAERGYNVTLTARRRERLEELADELREAHDIHVDVETCDLGEEDDRKRLIAKLLKGERELVGVCNNAGFGNLGRFLNQDLDKESAVVKLNVEAVHHLTGAFLPRMVEQGSGAILNVASTAASARRGSTTRRCTSAAPSSRAACWRARRTPPTGWPASCSPRRGRAPPSPTSRRGRRSAAGPSAGGSGRSSTSPC